MTEQQSPEALDVLIIGAGFSGMCAAILAREAGFSVKILEKAEDVGGVWRENTYPGAACDVPWQLYSYSFFKEAIFARPYPCQPDILQYQKDCANHYGLYDCSEFGVEVESAVWDEDAKLWRVRSQQGRSYTARSLISGVGLLSRPSWPKIDGLDAFQGDCFHSATWDHSVDLSGKRVAVIGTGASAIQFIPEVAKQAGQLTVFQRSAPYCLPRFDDPYGAVQKWVFRHVAPWRDTFRYGLWKFGETMANSFEGDNLTSKALKKACLLHLKRQVPDPEVRAKLTPDYAPGCKRVLFTSDYFPTYSRDNVSLHVDGIERITPSGILDKQGQEHAFDVLIMGTGFKATEFLAPMKISGVDGQDLHESWSTAPSAYLGISVPKFPNFFMMYGPNTNLGGNSIIFMIECQARYIVQALRAVADNARLEVRSEIYERYRVELQSRLSNMVWATGCENWYQTQDGHNPTNWPGKTAEYRSRTAKLKADEFWLGAPATA